MPMDLAKAVWSVSISDRTPVAQDFLAFLDATPYKGVTKDVWSSLLEFSGEVSLDKERKLVGYSEEDSSCACFLLLAGVG
jgi:hypothetical protein